MNTRIRTALITALTIGLSLSSAYADERSDEIRASFDRAFTLRPVERPAVQRNAVENDVLYKTFTTELWSEPANNQAKRDR